jgi:hypothetical protein
MLAQQSAQAAPSVPTPGGPALPQPGAGAPPVPPPAAPPQLPERPPSARDVFDQAVELLRSDRLRGYKIEVETDQMVLEDQSKDREDRVALVTAVGGFMQQAMPAIQMYPQSAGVLIELLQFALRGWKTGRTLEAKFEEAGDELMEAKRKPPAAPPPDPKMIEAQAKMQIEKQRLQIDQMKAQADAASAERKAQIEQQIKQQELQLKQQELALKQQELASKAQIETQRLQVDQQAKQTELGMRSRELDMNANRQAADVQLAQKDYGLRSAAHNKATLDAANDPELEKHPLVKALDEMRQRAEQTAQEAAAAMQALRGDVSQVAYGLQQLQAFVGQMAQEMAAPAEVVRGADGKPMGVRKGSQTRLVARDESGRVVGVGPATVQ